MIPSAESSVIVPTTFPAVTPCALMFVGEAPGQSEIEHLDRDKRPDPKPLVGPSGGVFNQLLRTANIDRVEIAVGNVFRQKAVDNNVGPWMKDEAVYTPALAQLAEDVRRADPAVIVPLGPAALWAFTGASAITEARGAAVVATRTAPGVKVLPTFHPAFVMRQWKMFSTVAADFVKADVLSKEPRSAPIAYSHREVWIEPTLNDLDHFGEHYLRKSSVVTIDIETIPKAKQITCVGFGGDNGRAIVVPFVDDRKPSRSYWATPEAEIAAWSWVRSMCELPQPKLMQNGTYDTFWLRERMGIAVRNYCLDTRLLHHALYPELPKSLAYMASCYTRQMPWKSWGHKAEEKRDA